MSLMSYLISRVVPILRVRTSVSDDMFRVKVGFSVVSKEFDSRVLKNYLYEIKSLLLSASCLLDIDASVVRRMEDVCVIVDELTSELEESSIECRRMIS